MSVVLFVVGVVVVLLTAASVLFTIVLPREPRGFERSILVVNRGVRLAFLALSRLARTFEGKDALLAPTAPVVLIGQLMFWAAGFILGYGLMLYGTTHQLGSAFAQAAGAVFTVGTIDVSGPANAAVDITAGATWVVIVALQIAYLPALYAAFNRREALVSMLESRAGLPAWGPEVLARQQLVGITDTLPDFYAAWEAWSADVAESHTTYPVMLLFRSPEPWFSWLIGLLAVMDGAAMHLALAPSTASSQARLCLRMGFTALNRIAKYLRWEVDPDPRSPRPHHLDLRRVRPGGGHAPGHRLSHGEERRGGLGRFRGVAGQLRVGGLPAGRSSHRAAGALVGDPATSRIGPGGSSPPAPALGQRLGRPPAHRGGGAIRPPAGWLFLTWAAAIGNRAPRTARSITMRASEGRLDE